MPLPLGVSMYTYHCSACAADYYVYDTSPKGTSVPCRNCYKECNLDVSPVDSAGRVAAFWYWRGESADAAAESGVLDVMAQAFDIWQARHRKYGRGNIATTGATGCAVRAQDKLSRLLNLYLQNGGQGEDETVNDTWIDLVNYAIMGHMCHNNKWPEAK